MWMVYVLLTVLLWGVTDVLYKKGADKEDKYMPYKFSVTIGLVFFIIAVCYLAVRDEPFSIWESAIRFWPVTVFGIIYAIGNTFSFHGFMYNEASIVAPVENIANGSSVILLVILYVVIGKAGSIWEVLSWYKIVGILCILLGLILLSIVQNREAKKKETEMQAGKKKRFQTGALALIYPICFSFMDGLETIVSGICLDKTYGFAMPEGDSVIIAGMEYAIFAFGFWIYVSVKEKRIYHPFTKEGLPLIGGAVCDNLAIAVYAYAMALDSVATDPVLAVYPILTILLSRILLKEKLSVKQYVCLGLILIGSFIIITGKNFC